MEEDDNGKKMTERGQQKLEEEDVVRGEPKVDKGNEQEDMDGKRSDDVEEKHEEDLKDVKKSSKYEDNDEDGAEMQGGGEEESDEKAELLLHEEESKEQDTSHEEVGENDKVQGAMKPLDARKEPPPNVFYRQAKYNNPNIELVDLTQEDDAWKEEGYEGQADERQVPDNRCDDLPSGPSSLCNSDNNRNSELIIRLGEDDDESDDEEEQLAIKKYRRDFRKSSDENPDPDTTFGDEQKQE